MKLSLDDGTMVITIDKEFEQQVVVRMLAKSKDGDVSFKDFAAMYLECSGSDPKIDLVEKDQKEET